MSTVLKSPPMASTVGRLPSGGSVRLDAVQLNRLQLFIVLALGLGLFFDTVELIMTNVLATVFAADASVSKREVSMMLAALFVGGAIGAPVGGRVADRIGRQPTLLGVVGGYAILSVACGLSASILQLTVLRFFCGMMLAAYLPVTWTYLAEVMPPRHRGRLVMIVGAVGACGASVAPLVSRLGNEWMLFGLEGWRFTLLFGGLGGLLAAVLIARLPESPLWLEGVGRWPAADAALARFVASRAVLKAAAIRPAEEVGAPVESIAGDVAGARFGLHLFLLMCLQFLQPLAIVGFTALSGVVLRQKGFNLSSSLLYLTVSGIGAPVGALAASLFVDRVARHKLYAACCVVLAAVGLAFALSTSMSVAMLLGAIYLFMIVVFSMTLNIYGPEMFVSERRGLASGFGFAAQRAGAAMVPLALLPFLLTDGALALFSVIALVLVVSALLVMTIGPRGTTGRSLH